MANDTIENQSNWLKTGQQKLGMKSVIHQLLFKAIHVPKKLINFGFIKVYKVSPNVAAEKIS